MKAIWPGATAGFDPANGGEVGSGLWLAQLSVITLEQPGKGEIFVEVRPVNAKRGEFEMGELLRVPRARRGFWAMGKRISRPLAMVMMISPCWNRADFGRSKCSCHFCIIRPRCSVTSSSAFANSRSFSPALSRSGASVWFGGLMFSVLGHEGPLVWLRYEETKFLSNGSAFVVWAGGWRCWSG